MIFKINNALQQYVVMPQGYEKYESYEPFHAKSPSITLYIDTFDN